MRMSETHKHLRSPEKLVRPYVYGRSIKQKLEGEQLVTISENKQPAGHGPGKSIEKFDRKFRLGDASNLNIVK